jgi:hypothetical protein
MKTMLLLLAAVLAACTTGPQAPGTIGPASVVFKDAPDYTLTLDSAWAFPQPEGYIVELTNGAQGVECPVPDHVVDAMVELDLFTPADGSLEAGDVPVVSWDSTLYDHPPSSTVAAFMQIETGAQSPLGKLTIIQPDAKSIAGKIDLVTSNGAGGSYSIQGEFEAYMCRY